MARNYSKDPDIATMEKEIDEGNQNRNLPTEQQDMGVDAFKGPAPDYIKDFVPGAGGEQVKASSTGMPRLKMQQPMSDEATSGASRAGEWWHNVAEKSLKSGFLFVPCFVWESAILWRPRADGGGILARATQRNGDWGAWDPPNTDFTLRTSKSNRPLPVNTGRTVEESRLLKFGTSEPEDKGSPPIGTRYINILSLLPAYPDLSPCVISFKGTSLPPTERWIVQMKMQRINGQQAPFFALRYKLSARPTTNKKGQTFLIPSFDGQGYASDEHYQQGMKNWESFKNLGFEMAGDADGPDGDEYIVPNGHEDAGARY